MTDYYLFFDEKPDNSDELHSTSEILVDVVGELNDGWAVNLRIDGELPEDLKEFEVYPETPTRIWL